MGSYLFIGKSGSGKSDKFRKTIIPDLQADGFEVYVYDEKNEYVPTENVNVLKAVNCEDIPLIIEDIGDAGLSEAFILDNYCSLPERVRASIIKRLPKIKSKEMANIWIVAESLSQVDIPLSSFQYITDFGVSSADEKERIRQFYREYNLPNFSYIGGKK